MFQFVKLPEDNGNAQIGKMKRILKNNAIQGFSNPHSLTSTALFTNEQSEEMQFILHLPCACTYSNFNKFHILSQYLYYINVSHTIFT